MTKIKKAIIYAHPNVINLLKSRKLKSLITTDTCKGYIDEKILICDEKFAHGIIILNKPTILDVNQFKNQMGRHSITEELREDVWCDSKYLNSHGFRIKKIFKNPIEYVSDNATISLGKFIGDVSIVNKHEEFVNKYNGILENIKQSDSVDGKEDLKAMFENLYELFLKKYSEKVANKMEKINV